MKNKVAWIVLSCLMVLSLLLTSCAPKVEPTAPTPAPTTPTTPTPTTPTPTTPTPTPTPGPEVPKYSGTFVDAWFRPHHTFDGFITTRAYTFTINLTNETLVSGDWTKGPAGTGETELWHTGQDPANSTGRLAESWELPDPETIIFHIRKGVHFALNPQSEASRLVNGREMTADDVVFSLKRKFTKAGYLGKNYPGWLKSAEATDKYTVVIKGTREWSDSAFWHIASNLSIDPPEVIEKYGSMTDWKVSVGTGPYMLTDYVSGSSYAFTRNPNYWEKDPVGPGKGNQLPYLDGIGALQILDKSTRLAAVRTAKIDRLGGMTSDLILEDKDSLLKTTPQLMWKGAYRGRSTNIWMRTDKPELPIYDVRVRRALQMAVDLMEIKDEYYGGEADLLTYPIEPGYKDIYTPIDKLPESTKELFQYNPEKAKALLAEAGYPNGFKTTITASPDFVERAEIITHYWKDIGVDLTIDVKDHAVFQSIQLARSHPEMIIYEIYTGRPVDPGGYHPTSHTNLSMIDDPYINERIAELEKWETQQNRERLNQLASEMALYYLDDAHIIHIPNPYFYNVWWPWVKNYHGEQTLLYGQDLGPLRYIWLDQNLKKKMME